MSEFSFVMIRLGSFMHIYVFLKTRKQMEFKQSCLTRQILQRILYIRYVIYFSILYAFYTFLHF